jgi:hypothetical protein
LAGLGAQHPAKMMRGIACEAGCSAGERFDEKTPTQRSPLRRPDC